MESGHVLLCLLAARRLQYSFEVASSDGARLVLLKAAGDVMDRTIPPESVKKGLAGQPDQLGYLIEHRHELGAVPPSLWRAAQVGPNELGAEHYAARRALDRVLNPKNHALSDLQASAAILQAWLAPVFNEFSFAQEELTQHFAALLAQKAAA